MCGTFKLLQSIHAPRGRCLLRLSKVYPSTRQSVGTHQETKTKRDFPRMQTFFLVRFGSQSIQTPNVVYVIIIDQCNSTTWLYKIQVTVIFRRAILVAVTSECRVKRVICKTGTRT